MLCGSRLLHMWIFLTIFALSDVPSIDGSTTIGFSTMNSQQYGSPETYIISCSTNRTITSLVEVSLQNQNISGAVRKQLREVTQKTNCIVESALGSCTPSGKTEVLSLVVHIPPAEEKCFICTAHFWNAASGFWQNDTRHCVTGRTAVTSAVTSTFSTSTTPPSTQTTTSIEQPTTTTTSGQGRSDSKDCDTVLGVLVSVVIVCVILSAVLIYVCVKKRRHERERLYATVKKDTGISKLCTFCRGLRKRKNATVRNDIGNDVAENVNLDQVFHNADNSGNSSRRSSSSSDQDACQLRGILVRAARVSGIPCQAPREIEMLRTAALGDTDSKWFECFEDAAPGFLDVRNPSFSVSGSTFSEYDSE